MTVEVRYQSVEVAPGRHLFAALYGDSTSDKVVFFDPGSFGIYADGHNYCLQLAEQGWFAIAATRAGMFGSDPVPSGQEASPGFHVGDIERLLDKLVVTQPVVFAGHSMAGVRAHLAGHLLEGRVLGLVLMDAVCPSLMDTLTWTGWVAWARGLGHAGAFVATTALGPLVEELHPNNLQIEGRPREDKLASVSDEGHLLQSAREVVATERKFLGDRIEAALHLPAFFATSTPISQGTSKLVEEYRAAGQWVDRIKLKGAGHVDMLASPHVERLVAGTEALWDACSS
ncbi:MAG: alpha/beta fold hydrolase [Parvularculaceae bacterium]|nr:alpha/beta fold hydrolase [Parvularculaceae bacterium]